jgi:enolase
MVLEVASLHAVEILDSRGRPTLSVELDIASGGRWRAGMPFGASTGSGEAVDCEMMTHSASAVTAALHRFGHG